MTKFTHIFIILIVLLAGCSSGTSDSLTAPDSDSNKNLPSAEAEDNSSQGFLGSWTMELDPNSLTATLVEDRTIAPHFRTFGYIPAPSLQINSFDPMTEVIDVDVTIHNTSPFSGFDLRAIIFTDSVGHKLMNADNWTGLFDIPGGQEINPFKAYAKDDVDRQFETGALHTENLLIRLPGGNPFVQFVIEVSFPHNCDEPYMINTFHQGMLLSQAGAETNITVEVHDWQAD